MDVAKRKVGIAWNDGLVKVERLIFKKILKSHNCLGKRFGRLKILMIGEQSSAFCSQINHHFLLLYNLVTTLFFSQCLYQPSFLVINHNLNQILQILKSTLSMQEDSPEDKEIVAIQKHIRGKLCRIGIKKIIKKLHTRKYVIEELISSQENYIHDLGLIISDFKMKLLRSKMVSEESIQILFSNVDEIRKLHEDFFSTLYNHFQAYHPYKVIFADILKNILFFRIYIEYLNNFPSAYNQVKILSTENPHFSQFLKLISKTPKYHLLHIEDYLVKPVQRLPKYVLLMKQIKKNTMPDHPDYPNICKALDKFEQVNMNNNDKLVHLRDNYKLAEIQNSLNLPEGIIGPGVQFVMEEAVQLLKVDGKIYNCTLYQLNTCSIVTRRIRGSEKVEGIVAIKHGTSLIYNEDQSYYKNSLTIQSLDGQSLTFLCQSEEEIEKLGMQLKKQIEKAEISNFSRIEMMFKHNSTTESFLKRMNIMELMPDVTVLGTSQRSDKLLKYTIYIVEIKVKTIRQKIFLRFSQILQIEQLVKTEFPSIQIKQGIRASGWLRNHYQKTIEERKMNIQRFLKQILSKPEIIQRGHKIFLKLGLPVDFYELPAKFKNTEELLRKSGLSQNSTKIKRPTNHRSRLSLFREESSDQELPDQQSIKNSLTIHDILKANQIDLGHYTRYSEQLEGEEVNVELTVLIPCIQEVKGYRKLSLKITRFQRIQCLMPIIAKKIQLKFFKDFRLFIEKEFSHRVLDDDELATKVLNEIEVGKCQMMFRKMIYVDYPTEQKQLKRDSVRLSIVSSQVLHEIKKGKYRLTYEKYLKFAVLVGIILNMENRKQIKELSKITKGIVLPKYTIVTESEIIWDRDYEKMYHIISNKLEKIKQNNSLVHYQQPQQHQINTSIKTLAQLSIVSQIKCEELFGSVSYTVQISQQFQDYIDENIIQRDQEEVQTHNCWLAIKCDCVFILSISLKNQILLLDYSDIIKIQPFANSLVLQIKNPNLPTMKLKTVNSYFIRELLLYYRNYNKVIKKMLCGECSVEEVLQISQDSFFQEDYVM